MLGVATGHADQRDDAGQVAARQHLLQHGRRADRLEGEVDPEPVGQRLDLLDRVGPRGVDGIGRAERARPLELSLAPRPRR